MNNEYVELLTETGLLGAMSFVLFLFLVFHRSFRALRRVSHDPNLRALVVGLTTAAIGILVQYNFFSTLYILPIWMTFGLLLSVQTMILRGTTHAAAT